MSDLNYNYLINKGIHRGGEEHKIARIFCDLFTFLKKEREKLKKEDSTEFYKKLHQANEKRKLLYKQVLSNDLWEKENDENI